jgi:hypothetical protein
MSLLTSGIAMAAYVCPQSTPVQVMEMVMDGPCAGMDEEKPVHCAEFHSGSKLAMEHLAQPPSLTPIVVAFAQPALALVIPAVLASVWSDSPADIGTDPPYLRTQRLRI